MCTYGVRLFVDSLRSCTNASQRIFRTREKIDRCSGSSPDAETRVDVDRVIQLRPKKPVSCLALNRERHTHPQVQIQVTDALDIFGGQLNTSSLQVLNQSAVPGALGDDCEFSGQCPSQEDLCRTYRSHGLGRSRPNDSAAYSSILPRQY